MAKEYKTKTLKNGEKRYIFDVNLGYDLDGQRIRKTITSKSIKEGRTKVSELRLNHKQLINRNILFEEAYNIYINEVIEKVEQNQISIATLNNKKAYRKNFNDFEKYELKKIDDYAIENWRKQQYKFKEQSRNKIETELSSFLNWCIKKKLLSENPFRYLTKTTFKKKNIEILTEEEFKNFISNVNDEEFKLLLVTLFYTGLRFSEAMGLKSEDVINNELCLERTRITQNLILSTKFKTPKSKRIVPIPSWLTFPKKEGFIFDKFPYSSQYNSELEKYIENTDFRHFTFHDLRHSYVSMCINKGLDIFLISELVGHDNIKMTINTYGHLYQEKRKSVIDVFGDKKPF